MPPASILASPGPRRLPPRPPGRPPLLPATTRPKAIRRAVSFSVELKPSQKTPAELHAEHAEQHALQQQQQLLRQQQQQQQQPRDRAAEAAAAALARRPALMRSLSLDMVDSSHIDPIEFARRRDRAHSEKAQSWGGGEQQPGVPPALQGNEYYDDDGDGGGGSDDDDDGDGDFDGEVKKPERTDNAYSAEEIALRRFMTAVAWGPGMPVIKHNRGKGRVRRVLKFNDQEGYLCWCGTLPPYYKTRVAAETLLKATRAGHLVVVQIANQGDVGFQCSRLTDAIVLEVGLNGVISACGQE